MKASIVAITTLVGLAVGQRTNQPLPKNPNTIKAVPTAIRPVEPIAPTITDAFTADQGRCPPGCPTEVCGWVCHRPKPTSHPLPENPRGEHTTGALAEPTAGIPQAPGSSNGVNDAPIEKEPKRLLPPVQDFEAQPPIKESGSQPYPVPDSGALENRPEESSHVNNLDDRAEDPGSIPPSWSSYFNAPKPVVPTDQPALPPFSSYFNAPKPIVSTGSPDNLQARDPEPTRLPPWSSYFNAPKPVVPTNVPALPTWSSYFNAPKPIIPTKRAVEAPQSFITVTRTVESHPAGETDE